MLLLSGGQRPGRRSPLPGAAAPAAPRGAVWPSVNRGEAERPGPGQLMQTTPSGWCLGNGDGAGSPLC